MGSRFSLFFHHLPHPSQAFPRALPEPLSRFSLLKPLLVSPRVSFLYQRSVCLPLELLGQESRQQVLLEQTPLEQKPPPEPLPCLREFPPSELVKPPGLLVPQMPPLERLPEPLVSAL